MIIESPIVTIIGNKGSCKTLLLTGIATHAHSQGRTVYSNFHLTNIPYVKFDFNMLVDLPEDMRNGVIVMDEAHMGADAYRFLSKKSKAITLLATQLRKLELELYITTQRFKFIAVRLRELTDYIFTMEVAKDEHKQIIQGVSICKVYDQNADDPTEMSFSFVYDGRQYFGHYDTKQVIL